MPIKPKSYESEAKMDMTPMIDIVFQLLIFFILVSELQKQDFEVMILPTADQAKPDVDPDKGRTTINVTEDGKVVIMGRPLTIEQLDRHLKVLAEAYGTGDKPILIRADIGVEYRVVQDVMMTCVKNNIWKLSFGAKTEKASGGTD